MKYLKPAIYCLSLILVLGIFALGQTKAFQPDFSVAGVKLGDRESAKALLAGYSARRGDDDRPEYYFYNAQATSVLKLVAASYDDPYFITEAEVFAVGQSYQKKHYQLEKMGHYVTESGIFVGFRQSGKGMAIALIVGVPNLARDNMLGPKDIVKKKGEPMKRTEEPEDREVFDYTLDEVAVPADAGKKYSYAAKYSFRDKKLKRFSMKIEPQQIAKQE